MEAVEDALSKTLDHTIYLSKKYLNNQSIGLTDAQKFCIAPLLIRSCHKAHSINILVKERLIEEAETMLRILIEISFVVGALCKESDFAREYGRSAWAQKRSELKNLLNGLKLMDPCPVPPAQVAHVERQLAEVNERVTKIKAKSLKPREYAEKAGLLPIYYGVYSKLCSSVHSGPEDLERFFDHDKEAKIIRIGKPKEGRVDVLLWTAIETTSRILKEASTIFKVEIPELEKVDKLHADFGAILMSERQQHGFQRKAK